MRLTGTVSNYTAIDPEIQIASCGQYVIIQSAGGDVVMSCQKSIGHARNGVRHVQKDIKHIQNRNSYPLFAYKIYYFYNKILI